jgi:large subunit ribosomal protein L2
MISNVFFTESYKIKKGKGTLKNLLMTKISSGGRNNFGRVTARHRGGGHKRKYRYIDFKRNKYDINGKVISFDYDPNRSTNLALINYVDGEKRYILQPEHLSLGKTIQSGINVEPSVGNSLPLFRIPLGTEIHNLELYPKKGGQLIRAAGTKGKILAKEGGFVAIRLPSKEVRLFPKNCFATVGSVHLPPDVSSEKLKAGRQRWLGVRPHVRGVVMNPCDHPHGGGEGRSPIGRKKPVTPWGAPALGVKTRSKNKKNSNIIKRRK